MRIITAAIIAATAVSGLTATAAFAAEGRLSDSQFIKAARCAGLAAEADAAKFNALVKANKRGRADFVVDKAMTAKADAARAARAARSAREGGKAEIAAELAGPCAALVA
jgi:hypothetical protein